jgi:type VI secretion system protein ImpJ
MPRLQPVIWSKGTQLTQQHLQIQDLFLENSLHFRLNALQFRPWGFQRLQIDHEALASGTFLVTAASGILPDGLLFDIPQSDSAPSPKPLAACFEQDVNQVDVYLAIPPYREGGLNVATRNSGADTRYASEVISLRDENSGLSEKPVQVARKNFRFLVKSELSQGITAIPAARVRRAASGIYSVDPSFVPPLVDFHASSYLTSIARSLTENLFARSTELAGTRRQKNQSLADFSASDIANFWLLYTINSFAPWINHLYQGGTRHPEQLFEAMAALAGSLTTFSRTIHPRDICAYDHENLSVCFADLDEKIRILLATVVPINCISLPLKLIQPSIYGTPLADDKYLKNTRMYLAVNAEASQGEIVERTKNLVKVCSTNHIEHLVRQALPGVPLTYVETPPNGIPVRLNYHYFSLTQSGLAWEAIRRSRSLAAYVPGELPNPQLELIVLLPELSA